ncbi:MAG: hypothetical protein AAF311_10210 [Pseudomonadota bacterium]
MFRDSLFYPLAALLTGGIVALALSVGGTAPLTDAEIVDRGWQLSGSDLNSLTVSPGSSAVYSSSEGGFMRLSQQVPLGVEPPSIGVFATLGPAHERAFAGKRLRVTFRARTARNNPLSVFQTAYVPVEGAPSQWTNFELGPDWRIYRFEYTPPVTDAEANVDLVAVFPGRWGRNRQMDLAFISVELLDDPPAEDEA